MWCSWARFEGVQKGNAIECFSAHQVVQGVYRGTVLPYYQFSVCTLSWTGIYIQTYACPVDMRVRTDGDAGIPMYIGGLGVVFRDLRMLVSLRMRWPQRGTGVVRHSHGCIGVCTGAQV